MAFSEGGMTILELYEDCSPCSWENMLERAGFKPGRKTWTQGNKMQLLVGRRLIQVGGNDGLI